MCVRVAWGWGLLSPAPRSPVRSPRHLGTEASARPTGRGLRLHALLPKSRQSAAHLPSRKPRMPMPPSVASHDGGHDDAPPKPHTGNRLRRFLAVHRRASLGAVLFLAATVCACDLSPQPLPPAGGMAAEPRAGSGSSANGVSSYDAASSAEAGLPGLAGSGSTPGGASSGGASGSAPTIAGAPAADAGGQDVHAGPDATTGSDAGRAEAGGEAGSGDGAAADGGMSLDGGSSPDGETSPDGSGSDAGCDPGCSREGSATNCQGTKVDWLCSGVFDRSAMETACGPALPTDAIRYCCPADFRRKCP